MNWKGSSLLVPNNDLCSNDSFVSFTGNVLRPSLTVVCRIDTLEKPHLSCKCIGFSVLKLFADSSKQQPGHDFLPINTHYSSPTRGGSQQTSRIFLNAGEFLLPIVYGKIPTEGRFCESLIDTLPHIPDAYLIVRLFDPANPILESDNHRLLSRGVTPQLQQPLEFAPLTPPMHPAAPQRSQLNPRRRHANNNQSSHGNNNNNNPNEGIFFFEMTSVVSVLCQMYKFLTAKFHAIHERNQQQLKLSNDLSSQLAVPPALQTIISLFQKFPLHETLLHDILSGFTYSYENEKKLIVKKFSDWVLNIFPPLSAKIPLVDARFLFYYHSKIGVNLALEMLYNMPVREKIFGHAFRELEENAPVIFQSIQRAVQQFGQSQASQQGAGTGAGKSSTSSLFSFFGGSSASSNPFLPSSTATLYDNQVRAYKAYFRYLPGHPHGQGGRAEEHIADSIVDDASQELDLSSREYFPIFNDDFSRTNGIELTPTACVLVVVVAVDVLTNTALGFSDPARQSEGGGGGAGTSKRGAASALSPKAKPSEKKSPTRSAEDEKKFKLRGLLGIYFGEEVDEAAVFWGVLPLLVESPFDHNIPQPPAQSQPMSYYHAAQGLASPMGMGGQNPFAPGDQHMQTPQGPQLGGRMKSSAMVVPFDDDEDTERYPANQPRPGPGPAPGPNYNNFFADQRPEQFSPPEAFYPPAQQPSSLQYPGPAGGQPGTMRYVDDFVNRNYGGLQQPSPFSPGPAYPNNSSPFPFQQQQAPIVVEDSSSDPINSLADRIGFYFVNAGLHQVPLFQGLPPQELVASANPMAWLLSHLAEDARQQFQAAGQQQAGGEGGGLSLFGKWFQSLGSRAHQRPQQQLADRPPFAAKTKPTGSRRRPPLELSSGASAVVNVVDPRLKKFGANSISYELLHSATQQTLRAVTAPLSAGKALSLAAELAEDEPSTSHVGSDGLEGGRIAVRDDLLRRVLRAKTMNFHQNVKHFIENKKDKAKLELLFYFNVLNIVANANLPASLPTPSSSSAFQSSGQAKAASSNPAAMMAANYNLVSKNLHRANQSVRSYQDAIPQSIHQQTLLAEINAKFVAVISDSLDPTPPEPPASSESLQLQPSSNQFDRVERFGGNEQRSSRRQQQQQPPVQQMAPGYRY